MVCKTRLQRRRLGVRPIRVVAYRFCGSVCSIKDVPLFVCRIHDMNELPGCYKLSKHICQEQSTYSAYRLV